MTRVDRLLDRLEAVRQRLLSEGWESDADVVRDAIREIDGLDLCIDIEVEACKDAMRNGMNTDPYIDAPVELYRSGAAFTTPTELRDWLCSLQGEAA